MNRMLPCANCGCPVLFHRPPSVPSERPDAMVCEECSKRRGTEVVCPAP